MSQKPTFRVEVVSDNVCPWCFVGKRNLDTAVQKSPELTVQVHWKPFYLNEHTPPEGEDLLTHLVAKYGAARKAMMDPANPDTPLNAAGRKIGINFNPARRVVNTRDSHRLLHWAHERFPERQHSLIEAVFHAYFEQAHDISKLDVLRDIANEAGFDGDEALAYLRSDKGGQDVDREAHDAQRRAISGVPFFTVHGPAPSPAKLSLSGGQPPEAFLEAFDELLRRAGRQ
jgi:predicted DsbA family dithiol-disulfide isomerase